MSETRPTKAVVNSVRQVLMNELGLTRESVREMVREVAVETAGKFVHSPEFHRFLKDAVAKEVHAERVESGRERNPPFGPRVQSFDQFLQDELRGQLRGVISKLDLSVSITARRPPDGEVEP